MGVARKRPVNKELQESIDSKGDGRKCQHRLVFRSQKEKGPQLRDPFSEFLFLF